MIQIYNSVLYIPHSFVTVFAFHITNLPLCSVNVLTGTWIAVTHMACPAYTRRCVIDLWIICRVPTNSASLGTYIRLAPSSLLSTHPDLSDGIFFAAGLDYCLLSRPVLCHCLGITGVYSSCFFIYTEGTCPHGIPNFCQLRQFKFPRRILFWSQVCPTHLPCCILTLLVFFAFDLV